MTNKKYFPKELVDKGDKLFGSKENWEFENSYGSSLSLNVDDVEVASVSLEEFPGCCGVVVITALDTIGKRNKGYSKFLSEAALYFAANLGYTLAVATTVFKNRPSNKIAESLGANQVASFSNRRTKNVVKVWTKQLPPKTKVL